tara:strand:- start:2110 stop:2391 length:282 start_codon:yes stop_codon:yes gene_type:complete
MPFKTGKHAGKLTRKEIIDKYGDNFEKVGKFWTRQDIINKLNEKGVSVENEEPVVPEQEVVEETVEETVEEVVEVVEEVKPAPKKKGRPKKQK